jgi:hypothetical protein
MKRYKITTIQQLYQVTFILTLVVSVVIVLSYYLKH